MRSAPKERCSHLPRVCRIGGREMLQETETETGTFWRIEGYDSLFDDYYICDELYKTRDEAWQDCGSNEYPIKVQRKRA